MKRYTGPTMSMMLRDDENGYLVLYDDVADRERKYREAVKYLLDEIGAAMWTVDESNNRVNGDADSIADDGYINLGCAVREAKRLLAEDGSK